jgi:hypothetical protein
MLKTIIRISFALSLIVAATQTNAQQASPAKVNLPVLGYTLDQSGGLRPIIGIAGAASVGAALNLGFPVISASVPASHDYILATAAPGSWPTLLQFRDNTITARSFDGANSSVSVDRIALSPTGSVAAFLSASAGRVFAYSNLSQTPSLVGTFDMSAAGAVSAFGISDDGKTALFGTSDGQQGALFVSTAGKMPRPLGLIHHVSAIQFMSNSSDAIIGDDVENQVYAFSNGQIYVIARPEDGIGSPVGIGISNDRQKVFVANSAFGSVTTIGLNGTGTQSMSCNCTVSNLQPMSADSVFQLTDFSGSSLVLFEANSATPRTLFVPAGAQF